MNRKALILAFIVLTTCAAAPASSTVPTIHEKTGGMQKFDGFIPFYWDAHEGKIWFELSKWGTEFLFMSSLPAGVGSNDIGLDRGQIGGERIVRFDRSGKRVLLIEPNYAFRAIRGDRAEKNAVKESFAESVLWGFDVAAEDQQSALVDASAFLQSDQMGIPGTLKATGQGDYEVDPQRCAFFLKDTRNFPLNTEIEATLTFAGRNPGAYLRDVVPTPEAVTVRERFSFIQLPDSGYAPRRFDSRAGFYGISYLDYASPIGDDLTKQFIARHRLVKKDPTAALSEPVKPIVYYVDRATPEPVRSALIEGASWWNSAFEAAGFKNAFRVEVMPPGADPLDIRNNVIQWVHRSTRGWSYGNSVVDPRTGEIIKGHVSLGSLRIRQDYLIATGLLDPFEEGKAVPPDMLTMALARIRQLAAHEVGHTLGLMHNYIASVSDRASVMDYPHPYVTLRADGTPDLSNAYATGIGEWDKVSIDYGYRQFNPGADEAGPLDSIIAGAMHRGLIFLTDQDARPQGSPHPLTHLWDNGKNPVDELQRIMTVRRSALKRFSVNAIRPGEPMSTLEDVFVPVYMGHRYQVEAAVKEIGGMSYTYAMRGDGQIPTTMVPPEEQRRALSSVLSTLTPGELRIPEKLLRLIPPRPVGYPRGRELFANKTGGTFDPFSAAEGLAHLTIALILNPARMARLLEFHARDDHYPGPSEVVDSLIAATWKSERDDSYDGEIQRVVDDVALYELISSAQDTNGPTESRALVKEKLAELSDWLAARLKRTKDESRRAHLEHGRRVISSFFDHPDSAMPAPPVEPPPGSPIGSDECVTQW